jgi:hypothetical protein
LNGNIIDSTPRDFRPLSCSYNNDLIGFGARIDSNRTWFNYVSTYSTMTKTKLKLFEKEVLPNAQFDHFFSMSWHPNSKICFIISFSGLWSYNIETKEQVFIRPTVCKSRSYTSVNVSSDGTKLICGVHLYKPIGVRNVLNKDIITIMNIDGSCEKRVL